MAPRSGLTVEDFMCRFDSDYLRRDDGCQHREECAQLRGILDARFSLDARGDVDRAWADGRDRSGNVAGRQPAGEDDRSHTGSRSGGTSRSPAPCRRGGWGRARREHGRSKRERCNPGGDWIERVCDRHRLDHAPVTWIRRRRFLAVQLTAVRLRSCAPL